MINIFRKTRQLLLKENNFTKYLLYALGEIILVVIGILIALSINNWNNNRKNRLVEDSILLEISNGLLHDLKDIKNNINGHKSGLKAYKYWSKVISDKQVDTDSVGYYYRYLTRDFLLILNTSGYESLKSKGLEIIENDSIRVEIITLYEKDYSILRKLEEEYSEMQFQNNYFEGFNNIVSPNLMFNDEGEIESILVPLSLPENEKKILFSYISKIKKNREFILNFYSQTEQKIKTLQMKINMKITKD